MEKRGKFFNLFILVMIFLIAIVVFTFKPSMTGFAVYSEEQHEKSWDFSNPSDYNYNPSLIEINNEQVKLIPATTQTFWNSSSITYYYINQAIYDSKDETEKVSALDDQHLEINKNKIFEIFFSENLENGKIISFYIKNGASCDIYLCKNGTSCNSPGYGTIHFPGTEGFYNITLAGLTNPTKGFRLFSDKNYGVNYLEASGIITEEHNSTTTSYPSQAEIETNDLEVSDLKKFNLFSKEHILKNQEIKYYYSTDSGFIWSEIQSDDLTTIDTSNKKIKIKAKLESNQTETPILEKVLVTYSTQTITCAENWTENYGECLTDDTKLKTYLDTNNCGTTDDLPIDNGTYTFCNYTNSSQNNETNITVPTPPAPNYAGGGGSPATTTKTETTETKLLEKTEINEILPINRERDYDIEVQLNGNSLVEEERIEGKIINKGSLDIEKLSLDLSQNLREVANVSKFYIENLKAGESIDFGLVKEEPEKIKTNVLTGFVTRTVEKEEIIIGNLVVKVEDVSGVEETVPLNLKVLAPKQVADNWKIVLIILIIAGISTAVFLIRRKLKKK